VDKKLGLLDQEVLLKKEINKEIRREVMSLHCGEQNR